jgi:hypothetical protein
MAARDAPRQLFYDFSVDALRAESTDGDGLPQAAPEYATPDGDYVDYAQPPSNATNSGSRRPTVMSQPDRRPGNGTTLNNDAYTGPRHLQSRWNGYMSPSQLKGPTDNAGGSGGAVPLQARPQRDYSRFWRGFNILTFLIACAALVIVLVHVSKPTSGSASTIGGVEASAVRGLSTWQEEMAHNLTAVQIDLAALINGLRWYFFLCFFFFLSFGSQ